MWRQPGRWGEDYGKDVQGSSESPCQQVGVGELLRCAFLLSRHLASLACTPRASDCCKLWLPIPHSGAPFAAWLLVPCAQVTGSVGSSGLRLSVLSWYRDHFNLSSRASHLNTNSTYARGICWEFCSIHLAHIGCFISTAGVITEQQVGPWAMPGGCDCEH